MCTKPHSTAALSSEEGTMAGRDYCCWAEWGLRQQLCKVSSAAASLGRTSKGYDRVFPESCQPLDPTTLPLVFAGMTKVSSWVGPPPTPDASSGSPYISKKVP